MQVPDAPGERRPMAPPVIGWDVGGAHLKACRFHGGRVCDVGQWACPLWQGVAHLIAALQAARLRWPALAGARHAITMTGEMADAFSHREEGVNAIAALLAETLDDASCVRFFAGDAGWLEAGAVGEHWLQVASANWLASARHAALALGGAPGVLIDIGSTTTDLIAFGAGRVLTAARTDAERLAGGELVYQGVVRTPLCALAPRIEWQGAACNVMNEFFATAADVHRLSGELDPAHDLHPSADGAAKDPAATRQRLARMIGLDDRDAAPADWLRFAAAWRALQVDEIAGQLRRVVARHGLPADTAVVSAGCGDFLVPDIARAAGLEPAGGVRRYGQTIAPLGAAGACSAPEAAERAAWAQVCAPSVAVAALFDQEVG